MILLVYFSCHYVCCHVMQINYCANSSVLTDNAGDTVLTNLSIRIDWRRPLRHKMIGTALCNSQ